MGAGWQVFRTILAAKFQDDETSNALGRGEDVGIFTGRPKNKDRVDPKDEPKLFLGLF